MIRKNEFMRWGTRALIAILMVTGVLAAQPDIDSRQAEKELAIMKSVISTTLKLLRKDFQEKYETDVEVAGVFRRHVEYLHEIEHSSIEGQYLFGQGVIFTIPYPCLGEDFPFEVVELEHRLQEMVEDQMVDAEYLVEEAEYLAEEAERALRDADLARREVIIMRSPPSAQEPPEAPEPPDSPEPHPEIPDVPELSPEAKARLERTVKDINIKLTVLKEESEEQKKLIAEERDAIKEELIEVIAAHGDSLSQLKQDQFINLVLKDQCGHFGWRADNTEQTVLSVRKSDVSAYRSGQITMDQLRERFVEY